MRMHKRESSVKAVCVTTILRVRVRVRVGYSRVRVRVGYGRVRIRLTS